MSSPLREPELDAHEKQSVVADMPARKLSDSQHRELLEMLAEIDRRREALAKDVALTPKERKKFERLERLAKLAGHGVSTWHAWRRKNDPTSPKFFDLRDFARAVGLDVRLLAQDASVTTTERPALKPETRDVVKWMERMPEEARVAIRAAVEDKLLELAARPPEAVGDSEGASPSRSSK